MTSECQVDAQSVNARLKTASRTDPVPIAQGPPIVDTVFSQQQRLLCVR
jgi:hypothetical protein